jgi:CheY-like chemotaxis protein
MRALAFGTVVDHAGVMDVSNQVRILVVDDEPPMVELVRGYLVREGWTVLAATDGTEALEIARTEHPDVVVLDLMLPGVDGIEVCRQIRTFSNAYVVTLTAKSEEVDQLIGLAPHRSATTAQHRAGRSLLQDCDRVPQRIAYSMSDPWCSEIPGPTP